MRKGYVHEEGTEHGKSNARKGMLHEERNDQGEGKWLWDVTVHKCRIFWQGEEGWGRR